MLNFFSVPALYVYNIICIQVHWERFLVPVRCRMASFWHQRSGEKRAKYCHQISEEALLTGRTSWKLSLAQPRIRSCSSRKEIRPPFTFLHGDLRATDRVTDY